MKFLESLGELSSEYIRVTLFDTVKGKMSLYFTSLSTIFDVIVILK